MKYLFALTYVLVLATQPCGERSRTMPHVWHAYASLEAPDFALAHLTAWGAAVAFELSTGVFTLRVIQGSRRRATRWGLAFFIAGSAIANGYYYAWLPEVFGRAMPVFATVALPFSLALFAEEFGTELKRERSAAIREQRKAEQEQGVAERERTPAERDEPRQTVLHCAAPGCEYATVYPSERWPTEQSARNALAGHARAHRNGRERAYQAASSQQPAASSQQ